MRSLWPTRSDSDRLAWPILLILLTVLVPSVGTVWMMREAVRNERLATGQRLTDAYQAQLRSASEMVVERWNKQLEEMSKKVGRDKPAQVFAEGVLKGVADSLLVCDAEGHVVYPDTAASVRQAVSKKDPLWEQAEQLEFKQKWSAAAKTYEELAESGGYAVHLAQAYQAQARCLLKVGDEATAIEVLQKLRGQEGLQDVQGRSFAAAAELRLLEVLDRESEAWKEVAKSLELRLGDYDGNTLLAPQRRFLMSALQKFVAASVAWPTQDAEDLATAAIAVYEPSFTSPRLRPTPLAGVWSCTSQDGRVVGLYETANLSAHLLKLTDGLALPKDTSLVVTGPQESSEALLDTSLGNSLAGWRLGLVTEGNPFDVTSQERKAVHAWIALLVVAATCVLGWLLASALYRRLRFAQLKNDLVATVSHELKTPLASIRLLVDTLLNSEDGEAPNNSNINVREYLELISHENSRLTRLIDNFLTFSRLERGKQRFDFQVIDVHEVIQQAAAIIQERWDDECLHVAEGSEALVLGDLDSLITVVVNLLENARKYSGENKDIRLTTSTTSNQVTISVHDNGIGLSSRASRRVFDRFYQVDQSVARTGGGCGLGLSIVSAIMRAHGGETQVESQVGSGSTFSLCLPKYNRNTANQAATVQIASFSAEENR